MTSRGVHGSKTKVVPAPKRNIVGVIRKSACGDEIIRALMVLKGPLSNLGHNIIFQRKVIFMVWLITYQKVMSLRAREPSKSGVIHVL